MSKNAGQGRLTPGFASWLAASSAITFPLLSQHMLRSNKSKRLEKQGQGMLDPRPSKAGRTHDFEGMRKIAERNGW